VLTLVDIQAAQGCIKGLVLHTPLTYSNTLSRTAGCDIFLKLENLQITGSFKLRGSLHKISLLHSRGQVKGVVAASAGNHAQGVAYAASRWGLPATIIMPQWASLSKQMATEGYGGKVVRYGADLADALTWARTLSETGLTLVHPYDDLEVIAGQGTIGLEILADLPQVDTVIVPVGGGGLAAGIALALKESRPDVHVIGVQADQLPSARLALEAGNPVTVPKAPTLADGINVTRTGDLTFPLLKRYLDEVVLVSEAEIAEAMLLLLEKKKVLSEGAGAVAAAALLNPLAGRNLGKQVVLVVSGGNVDMSRLGRVVLRGLNASGRLLTLQVVLSDTPGSLGKLTTLLGETGANILHLYHDRRSRKISLDHTQVELDLETRGSDHCREMIAALQAAGYGVEEKS
jgi:threonine dehydratase